MAARDRGCWLQQARLHGVCWPWGIDEGIRLNEPPGWLKPATIWLTLALGIFLGVQAWLLPDESQRFVVDGTTLELQRSRDGHYHWPGSIEGHAIEFLIDTGATRTAIPQSLAQDLGLEAVGRLQSHTANGPVVADVVVADIVLHGGVEARRLRVAALPGLAAPLLGMDVLGRLHWEQRAGVMRLDLRSDGR